MQKLHVHEFKTQEILKNINISNLIAIVSITLIIIITCQIFYFVLTLYALCYGVLVLNATFNIYPKLNRGG
jgi:hypothetical protein